MFSIVVEFANGVKVPYSNIAREDVEYLAQMGEEVVWIVA
jgi:hypothetical protein